MSKIKQFPLIPENICPFTFEEQKYIHFSYREIPYFVDLIHAEIQVPPEEEQNALNNLMIDHLRNNFGIEIKIMAGAEVLELNEVITHPFGKQRATKDKRESDKYKIRPGFEFIDTVGYVRQEIVKEVSSGKKWEIKLYNSMAANYSLTKESFTAYLDSGRFKKFR